MKTISQINELGNSLTKITSLTLVIIYLISFNFVKSQNAYTAGKYELLLLDGEYYCLNPLNSWTNFVETDLNSNFRVLCIETRENLRSKKGWIS